MNWIEQIMIYIIYFLSTYVLIIYIIYLNIIQWYWNQSIYSIISIQFYSHAHAVGDCRPISCARLLYKLYVYVILGRIEGRLEAAQPEEQVEFRPGRRLEEHALTATLLIEKCEEHSIPLWLSSLDLTKAFDKVNWLKLSKNFRGALDLEATHLVHSTALWASGRRGQGWRLK